MACRHFGLMAGSQAKNKYEQHLQSTGSAHVFHSFRVHLHNMFTIPRLCGSYFLQVCVFCDLSFIHGPDLFKSVGSSRPPRVCFDLA